MNNASRVDGLRFEAGGGCRVAGTPETLFVRYEPLQGSAIRLRAASRSRKKLGATGGQMMGQIA